MLVAVQMQQYKVSVCVEKWRSLCDLPIDVSTLRDCPLTFPLSDPCSFVRTVWAVLTPPTPPLVSHWTVQSTTAFTKPSKS